MWQRFNTTLNRLESSIDNGASWQALLISASAITGAFPKSQLPASIAYEDEINTFTLSQVINTVQAQIHLTDSSQPADLKNFRIANIGQFLYFQSLDDAVTISPGNLSLSRQGNLATSGTISVGGGQVIFPAGQLLSSNPNALDDYEEGSWIPVDGSGAGLVLASVLGEYTKIGNMCHFAFQCVYPATGSSAGAKIGGLPFACGGATLWGAYPTFVAAGGISPSGIVFAGTNAVSLYSPATGGALANSQVSGATLVMCGKFRTG